MYKFLWVDIIGDIWDNVSAQLNYIQLKYITIVWSFSDILIWKNCILLLHPESVTVNRIVSIAAACYSEQQSIEHLIDQNQVFSKAV